MRKSNIEIKGPANSPLVQLDNLACSDTFVDIYQTLYIVVTPVGGRVNGTIQCMRLQPSREGLTIFRREALVQPVDIKLEWSYFGNDTDTA